MALNPIRKLRGSRYTAVDFGHYSLKAVHCRGKKSKIKVIDCGQKRLPQNAIINGRVDDISGVTRNLRQLFDELNGKPSRVIFSPAVGQEFVRKVEIPSMPEDELDEALRWEVEEYLTLPPERVASDFIILEEKDDFLEVLLVVLPLDVLEGYEEVFNRLNIKPQVANAQELALISLLSFQDKLDKPSVIVNIGAEKTRIAIAKNNEFYLSRTLEQGGNNFTQIFKDEDVSWDEAENAKFKTEIPLQVEEQEALDVDLMVSGMADTQRVATRLREEAGELVEEITRSIEYYRDRHTAEPLTNIFISGGGLRLVNLIEYLEQEVGREITRIEPFHNIPCSNPSALSAGEEHVMSVALGLVASEVIHNAN